MPINQLQDAQAVHLQLDAYFDRTAPADRARVLRDLFVEILDFHPRHDSLVRLHPSATAQLPAAAEWLAELDGVNVYFLQLADVDTDRVRQREAAAAVQQLAHWQGDDPDLLLLVSNRSGSQLHLIHPLHTDAPRPTLRRMVIERDLPRRTAVQQVANIFQTHSQGGDLRRALQRAFDVEPVTKEFFQEYKRIYTWALTQVEGIADEDDREQYVQTLLNRLMFVYFLSRKGWLTYDGDIDYLNALWNDYRRDPSNFYEHRIRRLFFNGLNNEASRNVVDGLFIGSVPFLNGGLFQATALDQRSGITVPDQIFAVLFRELFDQFNFTVMESTPLDIEVAVDPEMLGKVFEELVTGRHDAGAYYTPRPVVSFMCREALKGYLQSRTDLEAERIASFVDDRQTEGLNHVQAQAAAEALSAVTVVDPACGSGAYLLGMMHELIELRQLLFNVDPTAQNLYQLKQDIIERNLYGADIEEFAVNIAMLRLWLSLAIDYEGAAPQPLPNLDFKIIKGDSLLGPDPSQLTLNQRAVTTSNLAHLKAQYLTETDGRAKERLREQIEGEKEEIRKLLGDAGQVKAGALDWRVEFAEVFAGGGFDVAIANPPYIQLQADGGRLADLYRDSKFETYAASGDIYCLFFERGCQLTKERDGLLIYITSNSWQRAQYGKKTRKFFANSHQPLRYLDLGKDVFDKAIVDSGVLVLRTGGSAQPFPSVDLDRVPDKSLPPGDRWWGEIRPNGEAQWNTLARSEWAVIEKMRLAGKPLEKWNLDFRRGVTTGKDAAFIIDTPKRNQLLAADPRSTEIIKPVVRGRDLGRFRLNWAGQWLITTMPAAQVDIEQYPAVEQHLLSFGKDVLEQTGRRYPDGRRARKKTKYAWFEFQDVTNYYKTFIEEKLFWMDISPEARFAYVSEEMYCNAKVHTIRNRGG